MKFYQFSMLLTLVVFIPNFTAIHAITSVVEGLKTNYAGRHDQQSLTQFTIKTKWYLSRNTI